MDKTSTSYAGLWRWYWINLHGLHLKLYGTLAVLALMLAAQALVPLQVESILHHGEWDLAAVIVLVVLVSVQLAAGYVGHEGAQDLTVASATTLRSRIFDRLVRGKSTGVSTLDRPSVVSRHVSDGTNEAQSKVVQQLSETTIGGAIQFDSDAMAQLLSDVPVADPANPFLAEGPYAAQYATLNDQLLNIREVVPNASP